MYFTIINGLLQGTIKKKAKLILIYLKDERSLNIVAIFMLVRICNVTVLTLFFNN